MSSMSPLEQALGLKDTLDALLLVLAGIEERGIPGIVQQIDDAALRATRVADEIRRQNDQAGDITGALAAVRQQLDAILATADQAVVQRLIGLLRHPELEASVATYHQRIAFNMAVDMSDERLRRLLNDHLEKRDQALSVDVDAAAAEIDAQILARKIAENRFQALDAASQAVETATKAVANADQAIEDVRKKIRDKTSMQKLTLQIALSGSLFMSVGVVIGMFVKPIIS